MIVEIYVSHMESDTDYQDALPEPFPTTPEEVEAADWSHPDDRRSRREAEVTHRFDDGGFIVSFSYAGGKYDPLRGGLYYVPPGTEDVPEDERYTVWYDIRGSYRRNARERRAVLIGRLNERTGFWWDASPESGKSIPLAVAIDGQKAIAAYLFAMQQLAPKAIAEKMDKSEQTIRQYLSDYKAGRTA